MIDLKNKKIFITGASSGIGRACAILCDSLGADLLLSGRNEKELLQTCSLLKKRADYFLSDLTKEEDIQNIIMKLPAIDGFVHCAGIINPLPLKFIKSKHIEEIFSVNFSSAVLLSSGLLASKKINNNASVVFISSISSQHPYTGGSLYTSSKAALEAFARGFALECVSKKIRVNTLAPALVKTKLLDLSEDTFSSEELKNIEKQYPLGIGEPSDVANAIVFLLGDVSRWITGTVINMDGGLLLNSK